MTHQPLKICRQVMEMQIKRSIEKIRGMMLVPLFLGALCHTFSPGAGNILDHSPTG
ncbi:2-keto-3-deoxygluconate permease [Escherichia coli]